MTALIRNLATMTRVGVLAPGSDGTAQAVAQLGDAERIRRARVHPIAVLAALRTYAAGRGVRGRGEWNPVREIVDALDAAFYAAFGNVEPAGTRLLLALDVSGSMTCGHVAGVPGLTPRDASAALALVTAATEQQYEIVGFFAGRRGWKKRGRQARAGQRRPVAARDLARGSGWTTFVKTVSDLPFGGTDCALPMLYAQAQEREIDTFVIFTDSETWAGDVAPGRRRSGLPPRVGHRRPAGRGRHGLERLLDRRSRRRGDARRRRLRHRDAAADLGLRPRRPLIRRAPRGALRNREETRCICTSSVSRRGRSAAAPGKGRVLETRRKARLERSAGAAAPRPAA